MTKNKLQTNSNIQSPKVHCLNIEFCNLDFIWELRFGIWNFISWFHLSVGEKKNI